MDFSLRMMNHQKKFLGNMSHFLKRYKTPKGIITAWFLDMRLKQPRHANGSCYNVQYGYEGKTMQKLVSEPKFSAMVKKYKWEVVE